MRIYVNYFFQARMIFFSRMHIKKAETSNQRDPGGVKPFTVSDEHNPSGKCWCLFHLVDILLFLLSEELLWSQEQLRARFTARVRRCKSINL